MNGIFKIAQNNLLEIYAAKECLPFLYEIYPNHMKDDPEFKYFFCQNVGSTKTTNIVDAMLMAHEQDQTNGPLTWGEFLVKSKYTLTF